jgi:hypothetical protein
MLVALWGAKGGVGTTVAAALCALAWTRPDREVLLVDLGGDQPAALGCTPPRGPGCAEWLGAAESADSAALGRVETDVGGGIALLARGSGPLGAGTSAQRLVDALATDQRLVVVDCGPPLTSETSLATLTADRAEHSWLVTRSCYLALSRSTGLARRPTGVLLVREPGRALSRTDVAAALDSDVVLEIAADQAIARSVDAGLLRSRMPHGLRRVMAEACPHG